MLINILIGLLIFIFISVLVYITYIADEAWRETIEEYFEEEDKD